MDDVPLVVAPAMYSEPEIDPDDTLVLLFMSCHPSLSPPSAIALTLRAVGGLTTGEIAKAFLVPEATMAQRISRAKYVASYAFASARGRCEAQVQIAAFRGELAQHSHGHRHAGGRAGADAGVGDFPVLVRHC